VLSHRRDIREERETAVHVESELEIELSSAFTAKK